MGSVAPTPAADLHGLSMVQVCKHVKKQVDVLENVLFDMRRRVCHGLVLTYFVQLGGLRPLEGRFRDIVAILAAVADVEVEMGDSRGASCGEAASKEVEMADGEVGERVGGIGEGSGGSGAAVAEAAAKLRGMDTEERAVVKKVAQVAVVQFLVLLEELAQGGKLMMQSTVCGVQMAFVVVSLHFLVPNAAWLVFCFGFRMLCTSRAGIGTGLCCHDVV